MLDDKKLDMDEILSLPLDNHIANKDHTCFRVANHRQLVDFRYFKQKVSQLLVLPLLLLAEYSN